MKRRRAWLHIQRQQHARNQQLIDALMQTDTATALALVNAGADPNTRFSPPPPPVLNLLPHPLPGAALRPAHESPTALMIACGGHSNPLVDDEAPLVCVAEDLSLLQAMLAHGADVNATTAGNLTALHFALITERVDTVQLLLRHGADVNAQDDNGHTLLMWAVRKGTADVVPLLLEQGANLNAQDTQAWTALHYAVVSPASQYIIPELLAHGADPDLRNDFGETPLELAHGLGYLEELRLLMQNTT